VTSINSLFSDHKNARKRTDQSAKLIEESVKRYGAARSIVIDEDNRILAGNGTIEGAKAAGLKNVRIIETDGTEVIAVRRTGLSEDEKVGLALADNRTSDLSDWDQEMLRKLSEEHDLAPWFEQDDLDELLAVTELEPEEGNTDPDEVPEAPEEPITKPGDLWILGNHRLLCGDSTNPQHVERLMDGKKADMVFTDPPYGIAYAGKGQAGATKANDFGMIKNDQSTQAAEDAWRLTQSLGIPLQIYWGANYYCSTLEPGCSWIVWNKEVVGDNYSAAELAWTNQQGRTRMFTHQWHGMIKASEQGQARVHPTQKPVALAEWAFNEYDAGAVVLDLFGGSGSTLIACEKTSRHCRMMELDPAYCDVIVKRWEDFTGNTAVCEPSADHFERTQQELDI
jgi:DNA modification methylase